MPPLFYKASHSPPPNFLSLFRPCPRYLACLCCLRKSTTKLPRLTPLTSLHLGAVRSRSFRASSPLRRALGQSADCHLLPLLSSSSLFCGIEGDPGSPRYSLRKFTVAIPLPSSLCRRSRRIIKYRQTCVGSGLHYLESRRKSRAQLASDRVLSCNQL